VGGSMLQRRRLTPRTTLQSLLLSSTRRGSYLSCSQWLVHQPPKLSASKAQHPPSAPPTMSESKQPPILIVGAGIAGLSLAAILQRNNIPYHVFESSPRTRSQGHGITLHSWAYLPLCKALDIDPGQLRHAVATDSAIGGTGAIDLTVHNVYSGGSLKSDFGTPVWGAVNNVYSFRSGKSAIQELLMKKVDPDMISWEWKLRSSELRNGLVVAGFENGESMTGRLIVAADGLHSVGMMGIVPRTSTGNGVDLMI